MPRLRLGVALLVPGHLAPEIDGLRRACGDGALGRVAAHLTLVPPVNVREADLPDALAVLRAAAGAVRPFTLRLGPPSTFLPATPTLHLAVGGRGRATAVLRELRDAVFRPPMERELTFPFVPHVTLADEMEPERITAAVAGLADYVVEARFERVHLLREVREEGERRWHPVADAPFSAPIVVGRGGVELELAVSTLLDPEAERAEEGAWAEHGPPPLHGAPVGAHPVVVVARRRGTVAGVARGWWGPDGDTLASLVVVPDQRRQGIARHLSAAFHHATRTAAGD